MYILQRFFVHESLDGNTERIDSGIPYMQHIQVSEALYVKFENLTNPAFLWFYMYFQGSQVLLFLVDIASINSLPRMLHKWQCHALLSSDVQSRSLCSIFKIAQDIPQLTVGDIQNDQILLRGGHYFQDNPSSYS